MHNTTRTIFHVLFLGYVLFLSYQAFFVPESWSLLDTFTLLMHEAGHIFFMFFGEFLYILGGSVFQILVPAVFVYSFWCQAQPYAVGFCLFWTGDSMLNLSRYVADARAQDLPLLYEDAIHDWNWLLSDLHLLHFDHFFGGILWCGAAVLVVMGLVQMARSIYADFHTAHVA
jgi:hypothetical protein